MGRGSTQEPQLLFIYFFTVATICIACIRTFLRISPRLPLFVGCIVNFVVSYLICMFQDSVPAGSYNDPFLSSMCAYVCACVCLSMYVCAWKCILHACEQASNEMKMRFIIHRAFPVVNCQFRFEHRTNPFQRAAVSQLFVRLRVFLCFQHHDMPQSPHSFASRHSPTRKVARPRH